MGGDSQLLSARGVRWLDVGIVIWVVIWAALLSLIHISEPTRPY